MKGQALAIAFVIAGGVSVHLLAAGMLVVARGDAAGLLRALPLRGHLGAGRARAERAARRDSRDRRRAGGRDARPRAGVVRHAGHDEPATGEICRCRMSGEPSVNQIVLAARPHAARRPARRSGRAAELRERARSRHRRYRAATIYGGRETSTSSASRCRRSTSTRSRRGSSCRTIACSACCGWAAMRSPRW
jgi:hypothetical protein